MEINKENTVTPILILSICYLIVAAFLYNHYGVKIVNDTHRYLYYADNLSKGFYFDPHNFWYIGYVIFIFFVRLLSDNPEYIILSQYLLSLFAVICLYKASFIITNDSRIAFLTSVFYIFIIEVLTWNSYLLPEAIYASAISISFYLIVRPNKNIAYWTLTCLVVLFTCIVKPTGIAFMASIVMVLLFRVNQKFENRRVKYTLVTVVGVAFLVILNKMLHTYILIENYLTGEIVYGITTLPGHKDLELLSIDVPANIYIPEKSYPPLIRLAIFVVTNPVFIFKMAGYKVLLFLLHIRPYWSLSHNLFVALSLYPVYFFAFRKIPNLKPDYSLYYR